MSDEPRGRLSRQDVAQLTEQIAGLSGAGLPLPSGLRALGEEQPSRRLRSVVDSLAASLESGESLDAALLARKRQVPGHLRGLVLSGMRTGRLSQVLGQFVAYANVGSDLRRGLVLSLAYPILAWSLSLGLLVLVLVYIGGEFHSIFKDFGVPVPWSSQLVFAASLFLRSHWMRLVEIAGAFCVLGAAILVSPSRWRNSVVTWIPLLGKVWWYSSLAEFCHLLGLLLESDVPMAEALRLSADGVMDAGIDRSCRLMAGDVEAGLTLSRAVARRAVFPAGQERILTWAEANRSLPESLHMLGEMFEVRARAQANVVSVVTAVLTVVLVLVGLWFTIVSLMAPLVTLLGALSG